MLVLLSSNSDRFVKPKGGFSMIKRLLIVGAAILIAITSAIPQEKKEKAEVLLKGLSKAKISLVEGIILARAKIPGKVLAAEVEVEKEKSGIELTYEVIILWKNRIFKVEVDGIKGKIKEVETKGKLFKEREEEEEEHEGRSERRRKREAREHEEEDEEHEARESKHKRGREVGEDEEDEEYEHMKRKSEHRKKRKGHEDEEEDEDENNEERHKGGK